MPIAFSQKFLPIMAKDMAKGTALHECTQMDSDEEEEEQGRIDVRDDD